MPVDFAAYDPDEAGSGFRLTDVPDAHDILGFLADHPETGFTHEEISEATDISPESVRTTLPSLEARDLVRHREPYWEVGDDDRLAVSEGMLQSLDVMEDRYGDADWGCWEETAVDPRRVDESFRKDH